MFPFPMLAASSWFFLIFNGSNWFSTGGGGEDSTTRYLSRTWVQIKPITPSAPILPKRFASQMFISLLGSE